MLENRDAVREYEKIIEEKMKAVQKSIGGVANNPLDELPEGFFDKQKAILETEEGKVLYAGLAAMEQKYFQEWLYRTNPKAAEELRKYIKAVEELHTKTVARAEQQKVLSEKDKEIAAMRADQEKMKAAMAEMQRRINATSPAAMGGM